MISTSRGNGLLFSAIFGLCLSTACKTDETDHPGDGGVTNTGGTTGSGGVAASDGGHAGNTASAGGAAGHASGGASGRDGGGPERDAASSGGNGSLRDGGAPEADSGTRIVCTATDRTDTDHDGIPDACDDDDDNDGFVDGDDPAPKDPTNPGTFYTPEQILANQHVQDALAAAKAAGHEVKAFTQHGAPAIAGYYVKPEGEGKIVASGNSANVDNGLSGLEIRVDVDSTDHLTLADVGFLNGSLFGVAGTETGALLRGENDEFTIYYRRVTRCPEPNQDSAVYSIGLTYAKLYDNGDWLTVRTLAVSVAVTGTVTANCAAEYTGNLETPGGWYESEAPRYVPTPLSDLSYMCTDDNVGYVPSENWARKDGTECTCTLDISVDCSGKDGG
jgi:hypothetical protein